VATEVDPDVLLVDEVLAVGDVAFQLKCLDRIRQFQRKGKTLMFVSHALQTVEEFCDEAFLIHKGDLVRKGDPAEVILEMIRHHSGEGGGIYAQEFGTRELEFTQVRLLDQIGQTPDTFRCGEEMKVEITFRAHQTLQNPVFGYGIKTANGQYIYGTNTQIQKTDLGTVEAGQEGKVVLEFSPMLLREGNYFLSISSHSQDHATQYHRREDWYPFRVNNTDDAQGVFTQPTQFRRV
jgi:ABC-type methionine transport system ATPase subunit